MQIVSRNLLFSETSGSVQIINFFLSLTQKFSALLKTPPGALAPLATPQLRYWLGGWRAKVPLLAFLRGQRIWVERKKHVDENGEFLIKMYASSAVLNQMARLLTILHWRSEWKYCTFFLVMPQAQLLIYLHSLPPPFSFLKLHTGKTFIGLQYMAQKTEMKHWCLVQICSYTR